MPKEVDYEKVGQRIRDLRIKKGMTQADLAALVDCSNNHLSHIETAQCKVSLNMVLKIAYALDTSLDYFLLDTPFARPESIINMEIASKLTKCSTATLVAINKSIDVLLELQEQLSE
ncbi:MAG: helix-turn-helix transcriptional regulator [Clostridia bacterium]|nr:helix-turn-helix transcriptional regulator [Clostridia bacterium]